MEITITAAARKHNVKKPALLWQVQHYPERFNARHIDGVNRHGLWFIDDECAGFVQWLTQHHQDVIAETKKQQYHKRYYEKVVRPKRTEKKARIEMDELYYTYELAFPESMGGATFYVGKGQGDRIDFHEKEARRRLSGKYAHLKSAKYDVIHSIWAHGEQVVKRKVQERLTEKEALNAEEQLIRMYGIANLTNGNTIVEVQS